MLACNAAYPLKSIMRFLEWLSVHNCSLRRKKDWAPQAQSRGLRCGLLNIDGQTTRARVVEIAPERVSGRRGWRTIWIPPCAAPTTATMALNVKF
jgi:hypothetical protein